MLSGRKARMKYGNPMLSAFFEEQQNVFMKKMILGAMAFLSTGLLQAQDSTKVLDEIIVTATKSPIKQSETGKVVSVITRQTIEENAGKTLGELLTQVAGVTINGADNNLGTNQTVFLRGASGGNTLILMDGIPLNDPSGVSGEFDLNTFDIGMLEKVEVLKGAQSTLYGSDAVAGVINLITAKAYDKKIGLSSTLAGGSYGTFQGNATVSGSTGKGQSFLAGYSKVYSNGFSSAYDSTKAKGFDNDGFDKDLFLLKFNLKASQHLSVSLLGKYSNAKGDIDAGAFLDDKDYTYHNDNTLAGVIADYKMQKGFIRFQYNANWYNRNFVDDSTDIGPWSDYQHGQYNGFSHYAELFTNQKLSSHFELLAGADYRYNRTSQFYISLPDYGFPSTPISGDSAKTSQVSGYASLHYKNASGFGIEGGGRINHHNIYGSNATGSINPYFNFAKFYKIYATFATAYKVPTLYQLYSEYGNKELQPESTNSLEGGIQFNNKKAFARVTGFIRSGSDVILFYSDPVTYASHYMNGDKQKDIGFEVETKFALSKHISITANYAFVDGEITTNSGGKDTSYHNLYKRPKNTAFLNLLLTSVKDLNIGLQLYVAGKAYESVYENKGYYTLGAHVNYKMARYLNLFIDLQNITDQKYFVTRGYNTRGFNFMAGLRLKL